MGIAMTAYTPPMELTQPRDVRLILDRLSYRLGIDTPKLKWSSGRRRGIYLKSEKAILIGPKAWNGVADTLLHCLAHAVVEHYHVVESLHGLSFLNSLWTMTLLYYNDPTRYGWYCEHSEIFTFGKNRCRDWLAEQEQLSIIGGIANEV